MTTAYGGGLVAGCVGHAGKSRWRATTGPLNRAMSANPRIKSKRGWMLSCVRGGGWLSPLLAHVAVRRPEILRAWVNR
jgi:hypothetical protein